MNTAHCFPECVRRLACGQHRWLALALLTVASTINAEGIDRVRAMALADSILKVEAIGEGGELSIGTAVSVAPGTFVTNCHVTWHAAMVVLVRGGDRWRAEGERSDLYRDVCLLSVPALAQVPAIPLAVGAAPQVKQPLAAAGYTGGGGIHMHTGMVTALHRFGGGMVIQTTTAFTSGASGGALVNATGELVGMLTFRLRGADRFYFAVPVAWIADRIDGKEAFGMVGPLTGPPPFWAQSVAALPFFMQAASLEHDRRWAELLELTDRWTRDSLGDPEAFYMRGISLAQQGQVARAVDAYRSAVALEPDYTPALLDLGKAYLLLGADADAQKIIVTLKRLDPEAADELAAMKVAPSR
jgi:serine protease Do